MLCRIEPCVCVCVGPFLVQPAHADKPAVGQIGEMSEYLPSTLGPLFVGRARRGQRTGAAEPFCRHGRVDRRWLWRSPNPAASGPSENWRGGAGRGVGTYLHGTCSYLYQAVDRNDLGVCLPLNDCMCLLGRDKRPRSTAWEPRRL